MLLLARVGLELRRCHSGECSSAQLLDLVLREVADAQALRDVRASPASGASVPAIALSSVDLPAPFGPSRPMRSPGEDAEVEPLEHRRRVRRSRASRARAARAGARRAAAGANANSNGLSTCAAAISSIRSSALMPALRLLRLGRLGAEAVDERLQVRDLPLLLRVRRLLQRELLRALALELRVVAGVRRRACGRRCARSLSTTPSRKSRSCVMSSSVPGYLREPVLEPQHGVEVEVVRRLVEQQQVGARHQRLREVQAHAPAAGEARHRFARGALRRSPGPRAAWPRARARRSRRSPRSGDAARRAPRRRVSASAARVAASISRSSASPSST